MAKRKIARIGEAYIPGPNAGFGKEKAKIYGKYIKKLEEKNGFITKEMLVDHARKQGNPLHDFFCWDDGEAAEKYRLIQAGELLQKVQCSVIGEIDNTVYKVRVWHSKPNPDSPPRRAYCSLASIKDDECAKDQILQQALIELNIWKKKYKMYSELLPLIQYISDFENDISSTIKKGRKKVA